MFDSQIEAKIRLLSLINLGQPFYEQTTKDANYMVIARNKKTQ